MNSRITSGRLKDAIISIAISTTGIGLLVGNAYMASNVGYPDVIDQVGEVIMLASLIFAILPAIPLMIVSALGVEIPLQGRESFIESNIWLWIYCAIFYACLIYLILRCRRRGKQNRIDRTGEP